MISKKKGKDENLWENISFCIVLHVDFPWQ